MSEVIRVDNAFGDAYMTLLSVGEQRYYVALKFPSTKDVVGRYELTGGDLNRCPIDAKDRDEAVVKAKSLILYRLTQITDALLADPELVAEVQEGENG